ncbi:MAG: Cytochrome c553 [Halomonas sp. 54_146]|nr:MULTISPECIES: cytochrome c [unclassified Halomonas]KUJ86774.1 MAG: Cytochrome c553 [Halomonas sp. 54_146]HAA45868.1 cytochrome C-555 [Halomonas sp.]
MLNKLIKASTSTLLLAGLAFSGLASAAGDAEAGAQKIAVCAACHGMDGKATADIYPSLDGQSTTYLEMALKAYRAGERGGGMSAVMTPQATNLSDQDIADIAAYYSQQ